VNVGGGGKFAEQSSRRRKVRRHSVRGVGERFSGVRGEALEVLTMYKHVLTRTLRCGSDQAARKNLTTESSQAPVWLERVVTVVSRT